MQLNDDYTFQDLADSPDFRAWVLRRATPEETDFWETWTTVSPQRTQIVAQSRALVLAAQATHRDLPPHEAKALVQATIAQIQVRKSIKAFQYQPMWWAAASVVLLLGIGFIVWRNNPVLPIQPIGNQKLSINQFVYQSGEKDKIITLSDGSKVRLSPQSELKISVDFGKTIREVFLTGQAFFEVQKNAEKPFLVRTKTLTTKVLGTSFWVNAYEKSANISVSVRTGRVSVYSEKSKEESGITDEVVLLPNQKAVFMKHEERLAKTLVEQPVVLDKTTVVQAFNYEDTPINQVLEQMEKSYGIKLVYDAELLKSCTLTASFSQELLYEQLTLICETIRARYEIVDGQIVIYARGCQ